MVGTGPKSIYFLSNKLFVLHFLRFCISTSRMASTAHDINEILNELLVVLNFMQVTIYIDINSGKNLSILKKYLASAVILIMSISRAMGKPSNEPSVNDKECIEDQCHVLLQTIINHICYIMYQLKNDKCHIIINKVIYKVLNKLKLYLDVSEVFSFFKDEDFSI